MIPPNFLKILKDFVVDLVVSEGYAYITNMDTAEKNRYPLPEE
jgi:hypothetical protein